MLSVSMTDRAGCEITPLTWRSRCCYAAFSPQPRLQATRLLPAAASRAPDEASGAVGDNCSSTKACATRVCSRFITIPRRKEPLSPRSKRHHKADAIQPRRTRCVGHHRRDDVGYSDIQLRTLGGRVITIIVIVDTSIGFIAVLAAAAAERFMAQPRAEAEHAEAARAARMRVLLQLRPRNRARARTPRVQSPHTSQWDHSRMTVHPLHDDHRQRPRYRCRTS